MVTSSSRLSYTDCYDLFDRALEDSVGVRVPFPDGASAQYERTRMHKARVLDREANMETYTRDHPLYGCSRYDQIVVRFREIDGQHYLYLENRATIGYTFEPLSGKPSEQYVEPTASEVTPDDPFPEPEVEKAKPESLGLVRRV